MGMGQYPRLVQGMGFLGDTEACAKEFPSQDGAGIMKEQGTEVNEEKNQGSE